MGQVHRRRFLVTAGALLAAPSCAWAQHQASLRRIAVLASDGPLQVACTTDPPSGSWSAFLEAMNALGYRHGQTVAFECRTAESNYERLDAIAAELVKLQPAVIVAAAAPASLAVKRATSAIPIVSVYTANPVGLGLVNSLARPGGNVTGLSALASDYVAKSLQLLKELAPQITHVGVLGHRLNPTFEIYRAELEPAARGLNLRLTFEGVEAVAEIETVLQSMHRRGAHAFLVMHQPFTFAHRHRIVDVVAHRRLPAMYGSKEAVEMGGLISYAVSVADVWRRAAYFVDRILKGARPADLPVEQPTKFELAVNRKTAKALGLAIPQSILLRADRVIE